MNMVINYGVIFVILLVLELVYFKIADIFNIIDKPNERSSHSTIVLRGGGVLFPVAIFVWMGLWIYNGGALSAYLPFVIGLILVTGVSLVDDVISLPDSLRLVVQFASYGLMFWSLGVFDLFGVYGWLIGLGCTFIALIVCVGATNIYNFMDGINGITAGYSLVIFLPLILVNTSMCFVPKSFLAVMTIAVLVFSIFNFRPKGKAKCFAGDVGSIGIAFVILFCVGRLIIVTEDLTWLIFLIIYGIDGSLTIIHRIMLHENLGVAHRKHLFQIMANELKMGHITVSIIYMIMQMVISLGFIYLCPNNVLYHWLYMIGALVMLTIGYVLFMKKFYHLHEAYLASIKNRM